jgi:hypothetical protein
MKFVEMYKIFTAADGRIWKIQPVLIPLEDVEHWRTRKVFFTKKDLNMLDFAIVEL